MKHDEGDGRDTSESVCDPAPAERHYMTSAYITYSDTSSDYDGDSASYTSDSDDDEDDRYNPLCYGTTSGPCMEREAMTVHEIVKMMGSVHFNEVIAEPPSPPLSSQKMLPHIPSTVSEPETGSEQIPHISSDASSLSSGIRKGAKLLQILDDILQENGYDADDVHAAHNEEEIPHDFFGKVTETQIEAYTTNILTAVRSENIDELKQLLEEGHCMQACNKFGESILHLACRRGCKDVVRFLVEEARISVNIRDDYGRTPLHDACWVVSPCFELAEILIRQSPSLLLMRDKRGFMPLQYVKEESIALWGDFLKEKKSWIKPTISADTGTAAKDH